jgi:hypothetical protein
MPYEPPARVGFRAVFQKPRVWIAEIAWRWLFGGAALALLAFTFLAYLDSLPVSNADRLMLRSGAPLLMADALSHILQGSADRLLRAAAVLVPGLAVLWTLAAGFGRAATLGPLMPLGRSLGTPRLRPLLGLSFLRTALALAGIAAYMGAAMLAGALARDGETVRPDFFFAVFIPLFVLVVFCWTVLNWFLSLAPLFAVRDGDDMMGSIAASVHLYRRNRRDFAAVGTIFGIIRLFALVAVTMLSLAVVNLWGRISGAAIIAAVAAISLAYFAVADFLYVSRLAAYAEILERDRTAVVAPAEPTESSTQAPIVAQVAEKLEGASTVPETTGSS